MQFQIGTIQFSSIVPGPSACRTWPFKQLPVPNRFKMLYSFYPIKQLPCYSSTTGWQPEPAMGLVCTATWILGWQQPEKSCVGANYFCNMKNPRKSPDTMVSSIARVLKNDVPDPADLPFVIEPEADGAPQEKRSPEEESFRLLLHNNLSRHKAPQSLRERIKTKIKDMPD